LVCPKSKVKQGFFFIQTDHEERHPSLGSLPSIKFFTPYRPASDVGETEDFMSSTGHSTKLRESPARERLCPLVSVNTQKRLGKKHSLFFKLILFFVCIRFDTQENKQAV
jgi:hypothetical protein